MTDITLASLGWSNHFIAQLDETSGAPARLTSVARDRVTGLTPEGPVDLITPPDMSTGDLAVGDWVLSDGTRIERLLDRQTHLVRRAPGAEGGRQLIAANVDTLGIVTSCNADFNPARLERYLALAQAGGCLPLIIVTKADLAEDATEYARAAERRSPLAVSVTLDARDPAAADLLRPWTKPGQTLALAGSSGGGKTTLTNTLTGGAGAVRGIREDDAKGRHTTTARELRPILGGGWLIDTPGMRELGLTEAAAGIAEVFADIEDLAAGCRFRDCAHETEPGCAVRAAIEAGSLHADRLKRWRKLVREDARSTESVAEARARGRSFARSVNEIMRTHRRYKGDDQ